MTIKSFIEKAIEGGWKNERFGDMRFMETSENVGLFLDPLAWQAVGKVEGWKDGITYDKANYYRDCPCACTGDDYGDCKFIGDEWQYQMHRMIDALAEGKTLEQIIETL